MLVEVRRLPRHVAIIMDGNGRWAQLRRQPRTEGHRRGSDAVRRVVRAARRLGIETLTLFAFSEQNWDRPPDEVEALMSLLREFLVTERDEILGNAIRLTTVGRIGRLPAMVREVLDPLVEASASHRAMTLCLALSYGGREEIADVARRIAQCAASGSVLPSDVDESYVSKMIPSMEFGEVDLLIRTGGEQRISNFLLWGAAYAELHFSPTLWPDYGEADFFDALAAFQARERRFGRTSAQVRESAPSPSVASHVQS
ncbi:MAG: polyprenyl diphosphate synthase [Myxococcota bacterium]|nr:polyprenyl diphosphate synthase [Myxococcota bacterium]MDW8363411.1 polyprenyl diphosphate synthase [Myxococcales bacterium]